MPPAVPIRIVDLGRTDYRDALERMRRHTRARIDARVGARAGDTSGPAGAAEDAIWLTEHAPVFTLGRSARTEHLHAPGDIPVVATERGGEATYHGPGQIVAYLMLDLPRRRLGIRRLVAAIEQALIDCLDGYGVAAHRRPGAPGIYVRDGQEKIASIGLKVSSGFSYHGLALNADMDLEPFTRIDPCGYPDLRMTDLRRQLDPGATVDLFSLRDRLACHLVAALGR